MHKAEVVKIETLSDAAIGVTFRCCDDAQAVTHTFVARAEHTDEDFEKWFAEKAAEVEQQHAHRERAADFMRKKINHE